MIEIIHIKALKYPDIPHYEWQGELLERTEDYVLILSKPGRKLIHYTKGKIFTINNTSLEYFSLKEGLTVAMEIKDNQVISYYCNVAQPFRIIDNNLSFVDLDLDLVKAYQSEWQVVDEEEFETNRYKFGYPREIKEATIQSLNELKKKADEKQFPFNENIIENLKKAGVWYQQGKRNS